VTTKHDRVRALEKVSGKSCFGQHSPWRFTYRGKIYTAATDGHVMTVVDGALVKLETGPNAKNIMSMSLRSPPLRAKLTDLARFLRRERPPTLNGKTFVRIAGVDVDVRLARKALRATLSPECTVRMRGSVELHHAGRPCLLRIDGPGWIVFVMAVNCEAPEEFTP
jgi:hypothetical protein